MYAFFLDIDGTVYDGKTVSENVLSAIEMARSEGHLVFINTLRAYVGMGSLKEKLSFDGFVNSLGYEVFVDGKHILREFIPHEKVMEIAKCAFDNGISLYFDGEKRVAVRSSADETLGTKNMEEFCAALGESRMCKFIVTEDASGIIKDRFSNDFVFFGREAFLKGSTKLRGIEIVEKYFGIPHENTVAIGDSDSDIDMVKGAGIGIAMGNGTEKLKSNAKYVTRTVQCDGVAYAIDCVLSGELSRLENCL